jgi:hypothetical protein
MIVGGALLLGRVANSHPHRLAILPVEQLFAAFVDEVCRFSPRDKNSRTTVAWSPSNGRQLNAGTPPLINRLFLALMGDKVVQRLHRQWFEQSDLLDEDYFR